MYENGNVLSTQIMYSFFFPPSPISKIDFNHIVLSLFNISNQFLKNKLLAFSDLISLEISLNRAPPPTMIGDSLTGWYLQPAELFVLPLIMSPLVLWSLTLVSKEFCCSLFSFTPELLFLKLLWAVPRKLCINSYHILPQLVNGFPFLRSRNGKAAEFVKYSVPTAVWVRVHDSDNSDLLNKQRLTLIERVTSPSAQWVRLLIPFFTKNWKTDDVKHVCYDILGQGFFFGCKW